MASRPRNISAFHRHLSLFEWSLLILARTLIWNRIWTTHMQRCNSNKFKLASMDFWYSERRDTRTGLEASAVDSLAFNSQSFASFAKLSLSFYGWLETNDTANVSRSCFELTFRKSRLKNSRAYEMELKCSPPRLGMISLHVFIPQCSPMLMLVMHF